MKAIILCSAILSLSCFTNLFAQCNRFFEFEEGQVRTYTNFDKKGKAQQTESQEITKFEPTAEGYNMQIKTTIFDKKGKEVSTSTLEGNCKNGVYTFDVRNLMNDEMMQSFQNMEVTVEGTPLEIPDKLEVGQELPSGECRITAGTGGATLLNLNMQVTDRKVSDRSNITTAAGTFDCYVIEQTMEMQFIFNKTYHSKDYISEKHGSVRVETYNKKGNLISTRDLTSIQ